VVSLDDVDQRQLSIRCSGFRDVADGTSGPCPRDRGTQALRQPLVGYTETVAIGVNSSGPYRSPHNDGVESVIHPYRLATYATSSRTTEGTDVTSWSAPEELARSTSIEFREGHASPRGGRTKKLAALAQSPVQINFVFAPRWGLLKAQGNDHPWPLVRGDPRRILRLQLAGGGHLVGPAEGVSRSPPNVIEVALRRLTCSIDSIRSQERRRFRGAGAQLPRTLEIAG